MYSSKWLYVWLKSTTIADHVNVNTIEFAYKEPTYKELPVIRNWLPFSNLKQGTSLLYAYKEILL